MGASVLTLNDIRARATRIFVGIAWANVLFVGLAATIGRNSPAEPMIIALLAAIIASIAAWRLPDGLPLRAIMAIVLTCGPIMLVYAGRGHASGIGGNGDWQIDYHMFFFGVFAILTAYMDWRPIAIAATLTALHHLVLDIIVPGNVFPEEGLDRVALHAVAVVAECGVLFWLTVAVNGMFKRVEEANALVELTASETAEALTTQLEENATLRKELDRALNASRATS